MKIFGLDGFKIVFKIGFKYLMGLKISIIY